MEPEYMLTKTGIQLTETLKAILREQMNVDADRIGMGIPGDEHNLLLCICLYDIRKNTGIASPHMISVSQEKLRYPSSYYDLYYMLVPCWDGDVKYRMEEDTRLLDVMLQLLGDVHFLNPGQEIGFELCDVDFDGKAKIWAGLNQPMHMAVYCKAGPVEVQSTRRKRVSRVTDIRMDFMQEKEGR